MTGGSVDSGDGEDLPGGSEGLGPFDGGPGSVGSTLGDGLGLGEGDGLGSGEGLADGDAAVGDGSFSRPTSARGGNFSTGSPVKAASV